MVDKHIRKFVGDKITRKSFNSDKFTTLDEILEINDFNNIFFKIDIEGSEYRILEKLISIKNKITSIAIEFYDYDLHKSEIIEFIERIGLNVIHIHANNYGYVLKENKKPSVVEMTLSRNQEISLMPELPHKLDMPNCKTIEEIKINF